MYDNKSQKHTSKAPTNIIHLDNIDNKINNEKIDTPKFNKKNDLVANK